MLRLNQKLAIEKTNNNNFFPDCYLKKDKVVLFKGIIASIKIKSKSKKEKMALIFLGVAKRIYIQINISNIKFIDHSKIGVSGEGVIDSDINEKYSIITVNKYKFY